MTQTQTYDPWLGQSLHESSPFKNEFVSLTMFLKNDDPISAVLLLLSPGLSDVRLNPITAETKTQSVWGGHQADNICGRHQTDNVWGRRQVDDDEGERKTNVSHLRAQHTTSKNVKNSSHMSCSWNLLRSYGGTGKKFFGIETDSEFVRLQHLTDVLLVVSFILGL